MLVNFGGRKNKGEGKRMGIESKRTTYCSPNRQNEV